MKTHSIAVAVTLALIAMPSYAEWTELHPTKDGNAYIDKANVVRNGQILQFRWLIDAVVDSEASKSVIVTSEINCNKRLIRHQQVVEYSEHMAAGNVIGTYPMTNQWIVVQRGSTFSGFASKFCYVVDKLPTKE